MSNSKKKKTILKWCGSFVLILVVLFILSFFFLGPFVKSKLQDSIAQQTEGAYALGVSQLEISLLGGNATGRNLHLVPDSTKINASKKFRHVIEVFSPEINIKGMNLWNLLFRNEISIDQLNIFEPRITWVRNSGKSQKPGSGAASEKDEGQGVTHIFINEINLDEARLLVMNGQQDKQPSISADKISFRIDRFTMATSDTAKGMGKVDFEEFTFLLRDYSMALPDSLYKVHLNSLKASVKEAAIEIDGLEVTPRYGKYEFGQEKGEQTDRMEFKSKLLKIRGIDFNQLMENEKIIASSIEIDSNTLYVFRDKNIPMPDRHAKLPQQQLRELKTYLKIDSVLIKNTNITYEEKVEDSSQPGHINFVNMQASFYNITNDSSLLNEGIALKGNATAWLMGAGKISAYFTLPIANTNNEHQFQGSLSAMELPLLNPMLKYVAFAEINSGKVNDLHFKAEANEHSSTGTMEFLYENLDISLVEKDDEEDKKKLFSFLANTFVVKEENKSTDDPRKGEMNFERDKRKSIINFWWKTLLSGLKDSLGVPESVGS